MIKFGCIFLIALALWMGLAGLNGLLGLVLAYLPLVLLAIYFRVGAREPE